MEAKLRLIEGRTPLGRRSTFTVREATNDDSVVWASNNGVGDEYAIPSGLSGWAMDVGAHIGAVTVPLALDNPELRVIALEAVPANVELLRQNVRANGLVDRVDIVQGVAGRMGEPALCHWGYTHDEGRDTDGYVSAHRFIANTWQDQALPEEGGLMESVSLGELLDARGIASLAWLKIDCEGCEWAFLDSPAIGRVAYITGEYHSGLSGSAIFHEDPVGDIIRLLEATHEVTIGADGGVGPFTATVRP